MLDQVDLVHMNGRVYDPFTAKFLSGDPLIQDPFDGQNYSRYSYVLNNPTNLTDPTGFATACGDTYEGSRTTRSCDSFEKAAEKCDKACYAGTKTEGKFHAKAYGNGAGSAVKIDANLMFKYDAKNNSANNTAGSFAGAKTAPATDGSAVGHVDIQQVFVQGFRQEAAAVADNHRGQYGWNWLANWLDGHVPRPDSSAESKIATVLVFGAGMTRGRVKSNPLNNGLVDLTGHRSAHILNRHRSGAGISGKTEFPSNWTDAQILHYVSDVATDPAAVRGVGKWDSPYALGTRDGINIRVDFYPNSHGAYSGHISTAYPTNVPPN